MKRLGRLERGRAVVVLWWLLRGVSHLRGVGAVDVRIVWPRHGARAERASRTRVEVEIAVASEAEVSDAAEVCVYVNGSLVACAGPRSGEDLEVPAFRLGPGTNWLHAELGDGLASSRPIAVEAGDETPRRRPLSLVLPAALEDAARALVLLGSLAAATRDDEETFEELVALVPDAEAFAFQALASHAGLSFPGGVRVIPESRLLGPVDDALPPYALQMALKLLASRLVATEFYLTLDADVVAVGPLRSAALLPSGRAAYAPEPRDVHPHWWRGSAAVLGLPPDAFPDAAFGVTPAVLSTPGALVVLDSIRRALGGGDDWIQAWIRAWGHNGLWWSEYTLYRLALDDRRLFDKLHVPKLFLCEAVWFTDQLPWNASAAFHAPDCLFSLVQSSTQAPVSDIAKQVYRHLRDSGWSTCSSTEEASSSYSSSSSSSSSLG